MFCIEYGLLNARLINERSRPDDLVSLFLEYQDGSGIEMDEEHVRKIVSLPLPLNGCRFNGGLLKHMCNIWIALSAAWKDYPLINDRKTLSEIEAVHFRIALASAADFANLNRVEYGIVDACSKEELELAAICNYAVNGCNSYQCAPNFENETTLATIAAGLYATNILDPIKYDDAVG